MHGTEVLLCICWAENIVYQCDYSKSIITFCVLQFIISKGLISQSTIHTYIVVQRIYSYMHILLCMYIYRVSLQNLIEMHMGNIHIYIYTYIIYIHTYTCSTSIWWFTECIHIYIYVGIRWSAKFTSEL